MNATSLPRQRVYACSALLLWLLAPAVGFADDAQCTTRVGQRLASLSPGAAVALGRAEVEGPFNDVARRFGLHRTGPQARDYSLRMAWAPDRRRALYLGANHGRPHRLNDVWEFDLCQLRWTLLYAPDNPRDYAGLGKDSSDVVLEDGALRTRRGGPAVIGHTWSGLTYDSDRKQLLWMNAWITDRAKAARSIGADPEQLAGGPPLWSFDPETRQWQRLESKGTAPRSMLGGLLQHVPLLGGTIWHSNNWQMRGTWLYRASSSTWQNLEPNADTGDFSSQAPTREQLAYLDTRRQVLVAQHEADTYELDLESLTWRMVLSKPPGAEAWPQGHDASAVMYFHPVSGHGLLLDYRSNRLWAYDPVGPAWRMLEPRGPGMPQGQRRLAYVDEALGIFVVIDDREVWAYRYDG